ncbi:uncharacterized protein LOC128732479 [Sabethes cyaneus]|uniref:uncharacterized protein LOC128732479 n=1 Tax=Sabethes cyaneus TaxID=53552 RepID=UPI00237E1A06|nr:uncharacterized protein LOC128732479 [Sabethes cyaneus]XP_053681712.1 uncharacterized protein LOC128732479 [Sabethes cyaneus]
MSESTRIHWNNLFRSPKQRLMLAQMITGIIIIGLEHPRPLYRSNVTVADFILFFLALSATLGTLVRLADVLQENHPIRKVFGATLWFRMELRFTGLAAAVLHCFAWAVLLAAIGALRYPVLSIIGSVFGFIASVLYLIDWWQLFQERPVPRGEIGIEEGQQSPMDTGDHVEGKYLAVNLASVPLVHQFGESDKINKDPRNVQPNSYI